MTIFLAPLVAGVVGLAILALPQFRRHGHHKHVPPGARHGHASHAAKALRPKHAHARLLLEPRSIFTLLAFYGAAGHLLAPHLGDPLAALVALPPALALELLVAGPFYRLLLGFEGTPSSPLEALESHEAFAVSEFRNGRGMVEAVLDGRAIQLVAELAEHQCSLPVRVGERVVIVAVDAARQGVTVCLNARESSS